MSYMGIRGPKPGDVCKKRKAEHELSQNPNTVKARERRSNMNEEQIRIDNAKNADRVALIRAVRALKKKEVYIGADKADQLEMEERTKKKVMEKRHATRRSCNSVLEDLGLTEDLAETVETTPPAQRSEDSISEPQSEPRPKARKSYSSPAAELADAIDDGKTHLLLAASGSVAVIKLPLIISALESCPNLSIRIILTKSSTHFLAGQSAEQPSLYSISSMPNVDAIYQDEDEWVEPWTRNAKILHIEARRWAHLLAIVPMSANLLAKVTGGICDNLITNVIRAWDISPSNPKLAKILVAPSMNTMMWIHPLTAKQMAILDEWDWFEVLPTQVKSLACGDTGQGGMCDWNDIVKVIKERLGFTLPESTSPESNVVPV